MVLQFIVVIPSLVLVVSAAAASSKAPDEHHKYCIVGAGPAGVQVGHYLQETGRDFVTLERSPRAASWFSRFPVHRVLNSINRRFTRRDNLEFNLRHDWNSLLGAEKTVGLFGTWSHEYWPSADTLVEYINAFAAPQVAAGRLRYGQDVKKMEKCKAKGPSSTEPCRFLITVEGAAMQSQNKEKNTEVTSQSKIVVNETATCASMGSCTEMPASVNDLVKQVAALEATVRNGNLDVSTLKDLLKTKEQLNAAFGGSFSTLDAPAAKEKQPKPSSDRRVISCSVLIMANGMQKPRKVDDWIEGLSNVKTEYEDLLNVPRSDFENRSVLILGAGNAATETADHVRSVSRDIQVTGRFESLRKMGESHYVGDVRSRRTTHEDAFYMKSYEGVHAVPYNSSIMVPCGPDEDNFGFQGKPPVCVFTPERSIDMNTIVLASVDEANKKLVADAQEAFGDDVFIRAPTEIMKKSEKLAKKLKLSFQAKVAKVLCTTKAALLKPMNLKQRKLLIKLRDASAEIVVSGEEYRKPYDVVITALGWHYDQSAYDKSMKIKMVGPASKERSNDKEVYPSLNGEFESVNVPHLFVAGAAAHGIDRYRYKGSGGFIHGFRFNCRTITRILEERYESPEHKKSQPIALKEGWLQFPWAFDKLKALQKDDNKIMTGIRESLKPLWAKLVDRINDAAGPYEMVGGSLVDSIVFDCKKKSAWYLEDLTEDMVHARYSDHPRLTWGYYYGYFHRPNAAHLCGLRSASAGVFSAFIHPVLQYFPAGLKGGPDGMTFSQTHQRKFFEMRQHGAIAKNEHPSAVWDEIEGISRLHIMEAYIFGDWGDSKAIRQVEVFMTHVEHAAAQFCKGDGDGTVERRFDESIDTNLDHPEFREDHLKKHTNEVCGGVLPQG